MASQDKWGKTISLNIKFRRKKYHGPKDVEEISTTNAFLNRKN